MAKLKFYGGVAGSVTGACYLIETKTTKILVDCGMFQGSKFSEDLNSKPFPFDPKEISALILTHAHIDHSGRIPKLYRDGFRGKIYGTAPTLEFTHVLLLDSEHVIKEEARRWGFEPFYNKEDVNNSVELMESKKYGEEVIVSDDVRFVLRNAGHILGSSIVQLFVKNEAEKEIKLVFSGDLGNYPTPIIGSTEFIADADYLLVESAYGDRLHESTKERKDRLEDVIEEAIKAGGTLMIPAFAAERTQELLFELNELVEHGRIKRVPIYLDSPLAIKITEIYKKHKEFYDGDTKHLMEKDGDIFDFEGLHFTPDTEQSKAIDQNNEPKIVIAGSGMSNGGRIIHHEKHFLPDPNSTLLIIGFQVKGSLGRKLIDGEKEVRILGQPVSVRAKIENIRGYSAHADQKQLLDWISNMRHTVKKVFVVQGDEEASEALAGVARDQLAIDAITPKLGEEVELV
jgi:metallo-beta-lactamase family protein